MTNDDWVIDPHKVDPHIGHNLTAAEYSYRDSTGVATGGNLAIECEDCHEVLGDIDFDYTAEPED